jgi:molybdenum cofactor cytidylyltransferase
MVLLDAFSRLRAPVVLPRHAGRRGHPVLFATRLREEILAAPDAPGARGVVHAHEADLAVVEVDDPGVLDDVDTPGDYARLTGRPVS